MNQKKCKRIRKAIRIMGYEKAPAKYHRSTCKYTWPSKTSRTYLGPPILRYPADSLQRVWRDYKAGTNTLFNRS